MIEPLTIDSSRFNNTDLIEDRVASVADKGSLRTALRYLYLDDGPLNLPPKRRKAAERFLDAAEVMVIRWLATRTNGRLKKSYGAAALRAARLARYRCQECGFPEVRVLNLDHIDGRVVGTAFACLCANCHTIKSRKSDWTGVRQVPKEGQTGQVNYCDPE